MTGLLILLAAIFTGCSCYYLSCAFADIPTVRTSKAMMTTRKQTGSGSEKLFDVYLTRIARLLAPVIRLDPVKRGKLQTTLEIAELSLTPEAYTAKAFLSALAVAFLSLPLFLIMPLLGFLVLGLSILMWFSTYYGAFDYVKKRKVLIEQELPRLAVSIQQSLAGGDTGNNFLHRLFAFHLQTIRRVITNRRAVQFFVNQAFQFAVFHHHSLMLCGQLRTPPAWRHAPVYGRQSDEGNPALHAVYPPMPTVRGSL